MAGQGGAGVIGDVSGTSTLHLWLKLYLAPGVGPGTVSKLLHCIGATPLDVLPEALVESAGLSLVLRALHDPLLEARVDELLDGLASEPHVQLVTPDHEHYPEKLRTFHSAPPVLFVLGDLSSRSHAVAVVGSRKPSEHRADLTRAWCQAWAKAGISVISGLAEGIDKAAHEGALDGLGHTVAVLGTGPDTTYPSRHAALQDRILASGGAVVSQYAPGTPGFRGAFPARNATLAGLADAVVIMQAGKKSGSLHTADAANKSNRPVLVAPSDLADRGNAGGLSLLRDKARAIGCSGDLLEVLHKAGVRRTPAAAVVLPEHLTPVHAALDFAGQSLDELIGKLNWPASVVLERLLALELAGVVVRQPGPRYARIR